jgi:hypothetical protein
MFHYRKTNFRKISSKYTKFFKIYNFRGNEKNIFVLTLVVITSKIHFPLKYRRNSILSSTEFQISLLPISLLFLCPAPSPPPPLPPQPLSLLQPMTRSSPRPLQQQHSLAGYFCCSVFLGLPARWLPPALPAADSPYIRDVTEGAEQCCAQCSQQLMTRISKMAARQPGKNKHFCFLFFLVVCPVFG